jgi:hypothetical protein
VQTIIKRRVWFSEPIKHSRMLWEGIFFMFWHSDKSQYQRDVAIKISNILGELDKESTEWSDRQKLWLESCLFILSRHWHKVDNFRIDKYLMLVRFTINQCFEILKKTHYQAKDLSWFSDTLKSFLVDLDKAEGLKLQLVDVMVPELGKVDNQINLTALATLLEPFLHTLANSTSSVLRERINENIFTPLLESNVTLDSSESEDSEPEDLRQVDGGKLSKSSRKAVKALINQKFVF